MGTPFAKEVGDLMTAAIKLETEIHRVMSKYCQPDSDRERRFAATHAKCLAVTHMLSELEKEVR